MFTEQDLKEIENIKQRDTESILRSLHDCLDIQVKLNEDPNNKFLKDLDIAEMRKSLYVTVKIMVAILKDRDEGIH